MAIFALNIKRSAVTGLALICLQNVPVHAESIAPNSDTRERWRVDYSDIGYPNVGFSPLHRRLDQRLSYACRLSGRRGNPAGPAD